MDDLATNRFRVKCLGHAQPHEVYFDRLDEAEEWAADPEQTARYEMLITQQLADGEWRDMDVDVALAR